MMTIGRNGESLRSYCIHQEAQQLLHLMKSRTHLQTTFVMTVRSEIHHKLGRTMADTIRADRHYKGSRLMDLHPVHETEVRKLLSSVSDKRNVTERSDFDYVSEGVQWSLRYTHHKTRQPLLH